MEMTAPAAPARELLFIARTFPVPLDTGQKVRLRNLLQACAREFRVTLVTRAPAHPEWSDALAELEIETCLVDDVAAPPQGRLSRLLDRCLAVIDAEVRREARLHRAYRATLRTLDLACFDLIWVERGPALRLGRDTAARTVFDIDDVQHRKRWRRLIATGWNWRAPKALAGVASSWYREVVECRSYRAITVCSDDDRAYLRGRWRMTNVEVVPNGFDRRWRRPFGRPMATPPRLIFLGAFDYGPNADAIRFFVAAILPLLRRRWPTIKLEVIGRSAPDHLVAAWHDRVMFHGYVDDVTEWLAKADMFVAPLRWGGGTKVKLLAAMASGLPIITTRCGAEGLFLEDERSARVAEAPAEFAAAIEQLGDQPDLAASLAANAFAIFETRFTWAAIHRDLATWLRAGAVPGAFPDLLPADTPGSAALASGNVAVIAAEAPAGSNAELYHLP